LFSERVTLAYTQMVDTINKWGNLTNNSTIRY
jgi:hypothetical protein